MPDSASKTRSLQALPSLGTVAALFPATIGDKNAAAVTGQELRYWLEQGVPSFKIGRKRIVRTIDLLRWLEEQATAPQAPADAPMPIVDAEEQVLRALGKRRAS
jgi:hypothetical protein